MNEFTLAWKLSPEWTWIQVPKQQDYMAYTQPTELTLFCYPEYTIIILQSYARTTTPASQMKTRLPCLGRSMQNEFHHTIESCHLSAVT